MKLRVENVSLSYLGLPVVQNIDFEVGPKDHVAVLGPSGCGKSTLLRMITGLEAPDSGRIVLGANDVTGNVGHLSLMSQQDLLLPWKTTWENVALPLLLKKREGRRKVEARVRETLAQFGLGEFAAYYPHQLSGGMRQRAAFLRTYLSNSEFLLLDEPFAALDAITRSSLQSWLSDVLKEDAATLVLVTHSLDEALLLASRVLVLSKLPGTIVLDEDVPFYALPFAEKPFTPEYLRLKRTILDALGSDEVDRSTEATL